MPEMLRPLLDCSAVIGFSVVDAMKAAPLEEIHELAARGPTASGALCHGRPRPFIGELCIMRLPALGPRATLEKEWSNSI